MSVHPYTRRLWGMLRKSLANKTCRNNSLLGFSINDPLQSYIWSMVPPCKGAALLMTDNNTRMGSNWFAQGGILLQEDSLLIPDKGRKSVPLHWWPLIMAINIYRRDSSPASFLSSSFHAKPSQQPPWIYPPLPAFTCMDPSAASLFKSNIVC